MNIVEYNEKDNKLKTVNVPDSEADKYTITTSNIDNITYENIIEDKINKLIKKYKKDDENNLIEVKIWDVIDDLESLLVKKIPSRDEIIEQLTLMQQRYVLKDNDAKILEYVAHELKSHSLSRKDVDSTINNMINSILKEEIIYCAENDKDNAINILNDVKEALLKLK